jgi:hypothetical protein
MPRINLQKLRFPIEDEEELLQEFLQRISEKGPWVVGSNEKTGEVYLRSDDFHHDVRLQISGDFGFFEVKVEYAQRLANRMNRMPEE